MTICFKAVPSIRKMHLLFIMWLLEGSVFCIIIKSDFSSLSKFWFAVQQCNFDYWLKRERSKAVSTVKPSGQINTGRKTLLLSAVMRELRKMQNQEMKLTNTSVSQWQADKIQLTRSPLHTDT